MTHIVKHLYRMILVYLVYLDNIIYTYMQHIVQILFLRKMDFITTIKISVDICLIQMIK